jgi:hypothetical protein
MKRQAGARINGGSRLWRLLTCRSGAPLGIVLLLTLTVLGQSGSSKKALPPEFQTSDRCIACHNGLLTSSGVDVSIGFDWRTTMMANSARDP